MERSGGGESGSSILDYANTTVVTSENFLEFEGFELSGFARSLGGVVGHSYGEFAVW